MKNATNKTKDVFAIKRTLLGRYGALALTRAAGEAASALRQGDTEKMALWHHVIADLRQGMAAAQ